MKTKEQGSNAKAGAHKGDKAAGQTGGVPGAGQKNAHNNPKGQVVKSPGAAPGSYSEGGHHHPHHPHANHRATGHHAMGGTIPSFHEAVHAELENEARKTRNESAAGLDKSVKD